MTTGCSMYLAYLWQPALNHKNPYKINYNNSKREQNHTEYMNNISNAKNNEILNTGDDNEL